MNNNNQHDEELMTTPQQPEQAETPVVGQVERRIAEIGARAEATSDSPWQAAPLDDGMTIVLMSAMPEWENDALFIAHARDDIPWLLDHLAALDEEHERLEAQSAAERRRTAKAEERVVTLTNENARIAEMEWACRHNSDYIAELDAARIQAQARAEAAEADSRRLDWMHRQYAAYLYSEWPADRNVGDNDVTVRWVRFYDDGRAPTDEKTTARPSFRAAIDAAMSTDTAERGM